MTERDPLNLTGGWAGRISTLGSTLPDLPFTASLEEVAGLVSGSTSEPNDVGGLTMQLAAVLQGSREASNVTFRRTYEGAGDLGHVTDHFGTLSPDGMRISGFWKRETASGGFEMDRIPAKKEEEQVLMAAVSNDFGALMGR